MQDAPVWGSRWAIGLLGLLIAGCASVGSNPGSPDMAQEPEPDLVPRTGVCVSDGLCWAHPLPQGNTLLAVSRPTVGRIVAVGAGGTTLLFNSAATPAAWSSPPSPNRLDLTAVYATADGTAFAAGLQGTLLRLEGPTERPTWAQVASGVSAHLRGLAGDGANEVWAVGDAGAVLHLDGARWAREATPTVVDLNAVYVSAAGPVYAVGDSGAMLIRPRTPGAEWSVLRPAQASSPSLRAVAGAGGEVWAAGDSGTLVQYQSGGTVQVVSCPTSFSVTALAVPAPGEVWIATVAGEIWQRSAGQWRALSLGKSAGAALRGLSGPDRAHLFAVGEQGEMLRYDGQQWSTLVARQTRYSLTGVWADAEAVYAVGGGAALRATAQAPTFTAIPVPPNGSLSDVIGAAGQVWAVGSVVARFDGAGFQELASQGLPVPLYGVWGSGPQDLWVAGDGLYHHDGLNFSAARDPALLGARLRAVGGASATDLWAVGEAGLVLRYNGAQWTRVVLPELAERTLTSVAALGPDDVWIVGEANTVLHWDGRSLASAASLAAEGASWTRVWARGPNDVWAVSSRGAVWRTVGSDWAPMAGMPNEALEAVGGARAGAVYLAGQHGALLRYKP